jgi:hypothetical protein
MKRWVVSASVLVAAALVCRMPLRAEQNPPASAVSLSGRWELDRDLTDRPAQIDAAIRADFGQNPAAPSFGGFENGRYGRGGRRAGNETAPQRDGQDNKAARELETLLDTITAPLRYPPTRLTIEQSGGSVTFTDPQGSARTLDTSGKREKQTVGGTTIEVSARFEGPQLVVEQDIGKSRTLTWTYSVLPATRQLLVRVAIARGPGELGPFEIKQVYNRTTP